MADNICVNQLTIKGKGMNEGSIVPNKGLTPDSDCNSNHQNNSSSYLSVSSQDVDFIQDNSDYQWFLDYNYRDGSTNHHPSLLSLPESYEAGDVNYYDTLAKNMDANLAEADMESFRTEDIHALLTNLPPMCTDHLSQESHRQGEFYASVSGSMMAKFDFDNSSMMSPHYSSSQGEDSTSMSICKSELLFSPVREAVPIVGGANFSVDSLDCDFHDMMLTCQANKDNYTIAFEGSMTMYSEESDDFHRTDDKSNSCAHFPNKMQNKAVSGVPMTQSDSGSFTTWSKLKKVGKTEANTRITSGNNNNSGDETTHQILGLTNSNDNNSENPTMKSQSMPNLYKKKLIKNLQQQQNNMNSAETKRKPVKVFNIQHQISNSGASLSDMATSIDLSTNSSENTNKQANFSLVKLFMKQKSMSTEGMSTTSSSDNWHQESGKTEDEDMQNKPNNINILSSNSSVFSTSKQQNQQQLRVNKNLKISKNDAINRSIQTSCYISAPTTTQQNSLKNPVKIVEPSFLNKLKSEAEAEKPIYVLYPNYVLPNLDFLQNTEKQKEDLAKVLLMPQNVQIPTKCDHKKRPFSCNDIEKLKMKGFSHVQDWESLNFLLPKECKEMLKEIPEIADKIQTNTNSNTNSKSGARKLIKRRPQSYCENCNVSSSSSTATQPSSGYRGSSTILETIPTNQNLNPLLIYRYDSVTSSETSLNQSNKGKRISLQEPYFFLRNKRLSETEDEGVDAGTSSSSSSLNEQSKVPIKTLQNLSVDELVQFEEFLKLSGISSSDEREELCEENLSQLRSYVSKFLSLKMNQDSNHDNCINKKVNVNFAENMRLNNSPNVSAAFKNYEISRNSGQYNMVQKWSLINGVTNAVELLTKHFSSASNQNELAILGNSNLSPELSKITLNHLCPALYAVLSDGLRGSLETSFGNIQNSVWQVVEASAKQGPLTKALNELVMRINSEDAIVEGLVKFNTFVFGLLNVRSLDAWASYLRTRESVLRKHYENDSLLILSHTGGPNIRVLMDKLITALQPLAVYPFQLDLFYETKQLHMSMKRMEALSPTHKLSFKQWASPVLSTNSNKSNSDDSEEISTATAIIRQKPSSNSDKTYQNERPRSCIESSKPANFKLGEDVTMIAKKRWSGIALNSKLYQVYNELDDENDYTDSLENNQRDELNSLDDVSKIRDEESKSNGKRFKKLQEKWEMMSDGKTSPPTPSSPSHKSRIPRPIISPVKPNGNSAIPVKKVTTPPGTTPACSSKVTVKNNIQKSRTSRVDEIGKQHHPQRPSSLPYKPTSGAQNNSKISKIPPRRAVSSSLNRKVQNTTVSSSNQGSTRTPKVVRTLSHRLPSESGHLSYNEGENLKVILKVDDKWLLCCRGNQKGLVPISAVISVDVGHF